MRVEKIKNTGSAMSACLFGRQVGLLVVLLLYRFYVVCHLSKWFVHVLMFNF